MAKQKGRVKVESVDKSGESKVVSVVDPTA